MFNSVCMYILNECDTRRWSWRGCDMCALDEHTKSGAQGEGIKQMMEKKLTLRTEQLSFSKEKHSKC